MLDTKAKLCLSCGVPQSEVKGRADFARGLCRSCHSQHRQRGSLDQFPRKTWRAEDLVAEADLLRQHGATRADTAERLGVRWDSITRARMRIQRRAEKAARAMVYTEHVKLQKIAPLSQSIGEFVEWLGTKGVHLMRWTETVDVEPCDGTLFNECRGAQCDNCKGANVMKVTRSGYAPYVATITTMLAEFFELDQSKIETEKRHMLETLRQRQEE